MLWPAVCKGFWGGLSGLTATFTLKYQVPQHLGFLKQTLFLHSLAPSLLLLLPCPNFSSPPTISSMKSQHPLKHQMHFTPSTFIFLFPFYIYLPLNVFLFCTILFPVFTLHRLNTQYNQTLIAKSSDILQMFI